MSDHRYLLGCFPRLSFTERYKMDCLLTERIRKYAVCLEKLLSSTTQTRMELTTQD